MKILLTLFALLTAGTSLLQAQEGTHVLLLDGKILKTVSGESTDTLHISKTALKKAKVFTIRFDNNKKGIWKRATWLQNENVTDPSKYTFPLSSTNGIVTIPAQTLRNVLKGASIVEIWTSLKPKNDMMMVRETRELIYTILID
ncbi:MAG: hypothetical protein V4722_09215 [Bacteroidota bacterium]